MASPGQVYHGSIRVFSTLMVLLGLAILAVTLANGGGGLLLWVLLGLAFLGVGVARLWMSGRSS